MKGATFGMKTKQGQSNVNLCNHMKISQIHEVQI